MTTHSKLPEPIDVGFLILTMSAVVFFMFIGFVPAAFGDPILDQWKSNMLVYGNKNCDFLNSSANNEDKLASTYYDAEEVFFNISNFTGDPKWGACARQAEQIYKNYYLAPNNYSAPGYWIFSRGLADAFIRTGDPTSKQAVVLLTQNASFCPDTAYNRQELPKYNYQRENAYAASAFIDAYRVGAGLSPRIKAFFLENTLLHVKQFFIDRSTPYLKPFFAALEAEFLYRYYTEIENDPRIPGAIKTIADGIWSRAWDTTSQSFWYITPSYGTETQAPTPDLNLLIAPVFQWVYQFTNDASYKNKADTIFKGGVSGAWLANGKQFNQNYRMSFVFATPSPTATTSPTPLPTNTPSATPSAVPATATPTAIPVVPTATPTSRPLCSLTAQQLECLGGK